MERTGRAALIAGGYGAALALAVAVTGLHMATESPADASSGMMAFGDALLFLGTFGLAALVPTGAALWALRDRPRFWDVSAGLALVVAATGLAALAAYLAARGVSASPVALVWGGFAVLRVLAAPFLAGLFFMAGVFSPGRRARLGLLVAAGLEGLVFGVVALLWLRGR